MKDPHRVASRVAQTRLLGVKPRPSAVMNVALTRAQALAEALVLMRRRGLGAACGHTSVVVEAPDDRLLQLLSPPDRTVPPEFWVALTASERAGPESGAAGETRASKRLREDTHDSEISDERDTRRRCLANAGEIPSVCTGASSHSDIASPQRSPDVDSEYMNASLPRVIAPAIPETDPYLLAIEKWPPAIKARCKCFAFPRPDDRRFGEQIVYLCSAALRVGDNLALQHALWLASKLRLPLVVLALLPAPLSSPRPTAAATALNATAGLAHQSDASNGRRNMAKLGALVEMRKALARLGIPLAAACCSPSGVEHSLQQWVLRHKTHMIITDSLRSPWGSSPTGEGVGGGGVWRCPVHGVDAEHVFPPHVHAAGIAQMSQAEFVRKRRADAATHLVAVAGTPYPAEGVKSPPGSETVPACRATAGAGLPGMHMRLQFPLFCQRADNMYPEEVAATSQGSSDDADDASAPGVSAEGREWVLEWPLFAGRGEGRAVAVAGAADWLQAEAALEEYAGWQAALADPPKTIALTASFAAGAAAASSATSAAALAWPLCTHMAETRALALLAEEVATRAGTGGAGAGTVCGDDGASRTSAVGSSVSPLLPEEEGEAFLEVIEPWLSVGALSHCRVLSAIHCARQAERGVGARVAGAGKALECMEGALLRREFLCALVHHQLEVVLPGRAERPPEDRVMDSARELPGRLLQAKALPKWAQYDLSHWSPASAAAAAASLRCDAAPSHGSSVVEDRREGKDGAARAAGAESSTAPGDGLKDARCSGDGGRAGGEVWSQSDKVFNSLQARLVVTGRLSLVTMGVWMQRLLAIVAADDWVRHESKEGDKDSSRSTSQTRAPGGYGYQEALRKAAEILRRFSHDGADGPVAAAIMIEGLAMKQELAPSKVRLPVLGRVPARVPADLIRSRGNLRWSAFQGHWLRVCELLRGEERV